MEIEALVDAYLDFPFKAAYVDRLLLDMLAGCEVVGYAKAVYGKVSKYEEPLVYPASFTEFLKGRAKNTALWVGLYVVASILDWEWAQTGVVWLGLIETIASIVIFPFAYKTVRKRNERFLIPLRAMTGVYSDLEAAGSISARHVLDQATKARDVGVHWPSPLFVLLEDVMARGGRF